LCNEGAWKIFQVVVFIFIETHLLLSKINGLK